MFIKTLPTPHPLMTIEPNSGRLPTLDEDKGVAKRNRASKPKVKSGCSTCKKRRVKCDETRPQCIRCLKSGRTCPGYPETSSRATSMLRIQPRIQSTVVGLYTPSVSIHASDEERRYFRLFTEKSAFELSGFFDTDFWTRIVLQESHSIAPIRHAVVALGALSKSLADAPRPHLKVNVIQSVSKRHYELAVINYTKSIQSLNDYISSSRSPQLRVALISCLLYICFETFVGGFASSVQQMYGGLNILKNYYTGKPGSRPWIPSKVIPDTKRKRSGEIAKALQIRPGCDNVSKDRTMLKHLEEYLESENEHRAKEEQQKKAMADDYIYSPHEEQISIRPTHMSGSSVGMEQKSKLATLPQEQHLRRSKLIHRDHETAESVSVTSNVQYQDNNSSHSLTSSPVIVRSSKSPTTSPIVSSPSSSTATPSPGQSQQMNTKRKRTISSSSPTSSLILHNENPIEEALIQTFVRLDGQGMFFGMVPGIPPLIWDVHKTHHLPIPKIFHDYTSAHRCWDFLMDRCLQFYRRTLFNRAYAPSSCDPDSVIKEQYASYIHQLRAFSQAYKPLLSAAISSTGEIAHPAALVLDLHHKCTVITLAAVISSSEMVFDTYLPEFRSITATVTKLISLPTPSPSQNSSASLRNATVPPRFALEAGIVPALHIVATKCRDPYVRREAVDLLFVSPRQEGMWDSVLTARIGKWMTSCEEDGLEVPLLDPRSQAYTPIYSSYPSPPDGGEDIHSTHLYGSTQTRRGQVVQQNWTVPEENRVHLVVVDFHIPDRYIRVKCQKVLPGSDGKRDMRETVIAW